MNRQITIRRLLAIAVIAGLVLAPLSRPVMAGAAPDVSMPAMADDMSMSATADDRSMSAMADDMSMSAGADEMANDMPCCPSKSPAPIDCDKCVFMAACMTKCFAGPTMAVFQPLFAVSAGLAQPQNDFWPDGLGHPPPEHPPRTLV